MSSRGRFSRISKLMVVLVAFGLLALTMAACGGDSKDDSGSTTPATTTETSTSEDDGSKDTASTAGMQIFSENCATCHTLAAADASGSIGPNLDDLKPDKQQVASQTENGGGGMPAYKDQLSATEIDEVSAYVAESAGN